MCARVISDLFDAATVEMTSSPEITVAVAVDSSCRRGESEIHCCPSMSEREPETINDNKPEELHLLRETSSVRAINSRGHLFTSVSTSAPHVTRVTSSADRPVFFECRLKRAYSIRSDVDVICAPTTGNGSSSSGCFLPLQNSCNVTRPGSDNNITTLAESCNDQCKFRTNITSTSAGSSSAGITWSGRRSTQASRHLGTAQLVETLHHTSSDVTNRTALFTAFQPIEAIASNDVTGGAAPAESSTSPAAIPSISLCRAYRIRRNHTTAGNKTTIAYVDAVLRRLRSTMTPTRVAKQPRRDSESRRQACNDNEIRSSTMMTSHDTWRLHVDSNEPEVQESPLDDSSVEFFGAQNTGEVSSDISPTLIYRSERMFESPNRSVPDQINLVSDIISSRTCIDRDGNSTSACHSSADLASNMVSARATDSESYNISSATTLAPFMNGADSLESSMCLPVTNIGDSSPSSSSSTSGCCPIASITATIDDESKPKVPGVPHSSRVYRRLDSGVDTMTSCRSVAAATSPFVPDNEDRCDRYTDGGSVASCSSDDDGSPISRPEDLDKGIDRNSFPISSVDTSASISSSSSSSSALNGSSSMADSWNYSCSIDQRPPDGDVCTEYRTLLTKQKLFCRSNEDLKTLLANFTHQVHRVSDLLVTLLQERHDLQQQVEMRQVAVEQLSSWQRVVSDVAADDVDKRRPLSTAIADTDDVMERSFTVPRSGTRMSTSHDDAFFASQRMIRSFH